MVQALISRWKLLIDGKCLFLEIRCQALFSQGLEIQKKKLPMELMGKVTVTDAGLKPHKEFRRTNGLTGPHLFSTQHEKQDTTMFLESNKEIPACGT